ncbi:meiotically up-regulated gene 157 (Mug157) protein [Sphingomonas kyeonggiensis]|uniref:Meiotically up-regulated gene 157 (Mug157) protein n=1 Tax=Sphingomonas kyeonggiensis TaxID=1268553 RepID=A0A7W7NTB7_9SPHN|nr:glycoside hydrolase family 125 protein [Sphingomonas kyeonggiensis]MBB4839584.1 meiotically up-regulated gene 157 (Mug157) protein [Sphingomonas kyeonggiensis]
MKRREVMMGAGALAMSASLPVRALAAGQVEGFASKRPPVGQRGFVSKAVEAEIKAVKAKIADPELAWLFENCYPNTLDTTVRLGTVDGKPDTFVITGDIDAMWLRDSSAQLQTYVHLTPRDADLRRVFQGAIQRQARCILIDSYANAFTPDPTAKSNLSAVNDKTDMKPGVAERKWEIDSLAYTMRLAHSYWTATRDKTPFDALWAQGAARAVATFREQQRKDGPGPYHFQRVDPSPTETLMFGGFGAPTRKVGLIHSGFRPSDDACVFPFLIPSNLFAVSALKMLAQVHHEARGDTAAAQDALALAAEVQAALDAHGKMPDGKGGEVWAFEVDGYGNAIFMDDANVPSLSGLPLLGAADKRDPLYVRTAALAWSERNPYFFKGKFGEGIGGPHIGMDMIWPMSLITRALIHDDDATVAQCLKWLKASHGGTGFMHESFHKDDPANFTRSWFAWANGLFGDLILDIARRKPALLAQKL